MTTFGTGFTGWANRRIPAAAVFVLFLLLALIANSAPRQALTVGDYPPEDLGRDASGNRIHLSDYRGKIVIVSFWASWCGPCRKEIPVLAQIQKLGTRGKIAVFAVNWQEKQGAVPRDQTCFEIQ